MIWFALYLFIGGCFLGARLYSQSRYGAETDLVDAFIGIFLWPLIVAVILGMVIGKVFKL